MAGPEDDVFRKLKEATENASIVKPGIPPATALKSNKQSWCRAFKVIFPLFNINGCSYKTQ